MFYYPIHFSTSIQAAGTFQMQETSVHMNVERSETLKNRV